MPTETLSNGHLCFIGPWELFTTTDGELYKAPANYPIDVWGYRQGARWEAPPWQVEIAIKLLKQAFESA